MSETSNSSGRFKQNLLQYAAMILWPLSLLYRAVTGFRNHLYDINYKKSIGFTPFVIDIGNLSVGGTGKSPMIEYMVEMLHTSYPLAVLSRGYGRKTRGFRLAKVEDTAETLGDEPFQFYRKFSALPKVAVAVGEERVAAVPEILMQHPDTQVILLDDAFQHRAIAADFHIVLTTYQRPFYQDHLLPLGRLREARTGARRANVVIVTKCPPSLSIAEQQTMRRCIQQYACEHVPVFFAGIQYDQPRAVFPAVSLSEESAFSKKVIVFSGIANSTVFEAYARSQYEVISHVSFGDHHRYSQEDIVKLVTVAKNAGKNVCLLTTEKDMVKLLNDKTSALLHEVPLFYLPIQTCFLHDEATFKGVVLHHMQQYYQKEATNHL